jgi:hypothetical protein
MGSIDRRPSGRWRARYWDPEGRQRSQTFDRKGDAERFLQRNGVGLTRFDGQVDYAAPWRGCCWICCSYSTGVR